jgi:hypothetical protein
MGDLKPLGSEKLNGDDKLKRILQLTYYKQNPITENTGSKKAELIKESANGVYGIVREKDGYYVKKGLNENTLDYIGGLFMKNKNKFSSYAEALKRLELLKSQELNEDVTRYVLKQNKPAQEAPVPAPSIDAAPAPAGEPVGELPPPAPEMGAEAPMPEEPAMDNEPMSSSEEGKRSDYMAEVQKFAGKLGQELRDQQPKMESDDIKYVLNMIISAVDLDKLEDDDIEDIGKKFERDEESMGEPEMGEPAPEEEMPSDEEVPSTPEDDLAERISKLEELINTKFYSEGEKELNEYGDVEEDFFYSEDDFKNQEPSSIPSSMPMQQEKPSRLMRGANPNSSWYDDSSKDFGQGNFDENDYDEEDFDDHDTFMSKHGEGHNHDLRSKKYFDMYKPIKVKTLRKNNDLDITPELNDINESIKNTLSKYFE